MRIIYLHQYFKTPAEPGGTRSYWIARELIKNGHTVTMITTSNTINAKVERKNIDGIEVIYLKVPYDNGMGLFKRLMAFVNFMYKSTILAYREKNTDLVISTSTPLTIGFPALVLRKLKKVPYLFEVRDLWPEVPIQMGAIKNPLIIKLANWFEKTIYKNAWHIVALSPGMEEGVKAKKIPQEKISMIPNMAKIDEFWPRQKDMELIRQLNLREDTFKIIHFGSLGLANGASYIIDAAALLKEDNNIEFIFLGGGATEKSLRERCISENLSHVHFLGKFPMDKTSAIVNFCDVSMVSFLDLPILYTNSPNKLFDSLSAGKPIIVNSRGWTRDLVEKYRCGFFAEPSSPQDMADKIRYMRDSPQAVEAMGKASRNLAETKYDKSILCSEFADIINTFRQK